MGWRKLLFGCCYKGGDDNSTDGVSLDVLSDDTITEILSRVPAKTVVACKRVCRWWNSLINTPSFVEAHRKRAVERSTILVEHGYRCDRHSIFIDHTTTEKGSNKMWRLSRKHSRRGYMAPHLFSSCDGMVLSSYAHTFEIYNPLTDEGIVVTTPIENVSCCGFFFDEISNEYKIIMFSRCEFASSKARDQKHTTAVYYTYGMSTKLLREICKSKFHPKGRCSASLNVHNNVVCWKVGPWDRCFECIMIYMVDTGKMCVIPHPGKTCFGFNNRDEAYRMMQLCEMENRIACTEIRNCFINIWVLEDLVNFSWVKRHVVDLLQVGFNTHQYIQVLNIDEGKLLVRWPSRRLMWYNLHSKHVDRIEQRSGYNLKYVGRLTSINLKPSLVSPNHITSYQFVEEAEEANCDVKLEGEGVLCSGENEVGSLCDSGEEEEEHVSHSALDSPT